jgi:hypothetical protein
MILRGEPEIVTVHIGKKIKRKRKGRVEFIRDPEDKVYRI